MNEGPFPIKQLSVSLAKNLNRLCSYKKRDLVHTIPVLYMSGNIYMQSIVSRADCFVIQEISVPVNIAAIVF